MKTGIITVPTLSYKWDIIIIIIIMHSLNYKSLLRNTVYTYIVYTADELSNTQFYTTGETRIY